MLARAPEAITLGEIIRVLSGNHALVECFREDGGRCVLRPGCRLRLKLAGAIRDSVATVRRDRVAASSGFATI